MEAELQAWYRANGRDLPWRRTRDPYAILVAEVMLQQNVVRNMKASVSRFFMRSTGSLVTGKQPSRGYCGQRSFA